MGRVPDGELERLKREVSVARLAEVRGIALTRHGADLHGLCPFHEDKNPSLWTLVGAVLGEEAVEDLEDGAALRAG